MTTRHLLQLPNAAPDVRISEPRSTIGAIIRMDGRLGILFETAQRNEHDRRTWRIAENVLSSGVAGVRLDVDDNAERSIGRLN